MEDHEFLKQLIKDLKDDLNNRISEICKEIKSINENNKNAIKELYEERNRLDKEILKTTMMISENSKQMEVLIKKWEENDKITEKLKWQMSLITWIGGGIGSVTLIYIATMVLTKLFKG